MIEETIPTWDSFCEHQELAILAANQEYILQYEDIVRTYASFASKDNPVQNKTTKTLPVRLRYRKAGLSAMRAIADSDSLASSETNQQLAVVVPIILENLYAQDGSYLSTLENREEARTGKERELALRRRQSTPVVATEASTSDPVAAAGSIETADRLAEQEVGVIALQTLKRLFAVVSRGQLRLSTLQVLKFMADRIDPKEHFPSSTIIPLHSGSWPCMLFELICSWVPVQDRHVILVSAVEELTKTPFQEQQFSKHYVLVTITGWLLSSEVNFIGLSVMDVLVGLMQHMQALVQLPSSSPANGKHISEPGMIAPERIISPDEEHTEFGASYPQEATRSQLLSQLQRCVGCLAVHVYYTEQIGDMISAVLQRIQPPVAGAVLASGFTNDGHHREDLGSTSSSAEKSASVGYFNTDKARLAALRTIKEIIIWANWTSPDGTSALNTRNPVVIGRWDGSQWLLTETNWETRAAYVEVLLTWMHFELNKSNLRAPPESHRRSSKAEKRELQQKESLARRAVSNASHRELSHGPQSKFLPLIHLAIYDNAHQYSQSESDILLLHLLLSNLIAKLGVNALQHGLPMIMRLQDDLSDLDDAVSKIHVASLVHGYLWATSVQLHFDASQTGRMIALEISQRMKQDAWLSSARMPPMPLEEILQRSQSSSLNVLPNLESLALKPFDRPDVIADKVAEGYEVSLYSPPNSPPTSPSRVFSSTPILEQAPPFPGRQVPNHLPQNIRDNLLSDWTREGIIAMTSKQNDSHSGSVSGSPTAGRHLSITVPGLHVANGDGQPSPRRSHPHAHANLHVPHSRSQRPSSGSHSHRPHSLRDAFHHNVATGLRSGLASQVVSPVASTTSVRSSVRVEDLKRALHGQVSQPPSSAVQRQEFKEDDSASESMVSYEGSDTSGVYVDSRSVAEVSEPDSTPQIERNVVGSPPKEVRTEDSLTSRPLTDNMTLRPSSTRDRSGSISTIEDVDENGDVPPVPPLPESYVSLTPSQTPDSSTRRSMAENSSKRPAMLASSPSATKAETLKSKTVRESLRRSISTRDGVLPPPSRQGHQEKAKHWNANDLLESIEAEGVTPVPGVGMNRNGTGMKPPY